MSDITEGNYKHVDLLVDNSPKPNKNHVEAAAILEAEIENPKVHNIAVMAKNGAGKSSAIETYLCIYRSDPDSFDKMYGNLGVAKTSVDKILSEAGETSTRLNALRDVPGEGAERDGLLEELNGLVKDIGEAAKKIESVGIGLDAATEALNAATGDILSAVDGIGGPAANLKLVCDDFGCAVENITASSRDVEEMTGFLDSVKAKRAQRDVDGAKSATSWKRSRAHKGKTYAGVSLASFNDAEYSEVDVERSVLQQLLYSRDKKNFPDSKIKRTEKPTGCVKAFPYLLSALIVCIFLFIVGVVAIRFLSSECAACSACGRCPKYPSCLTCSECPTYLKWIYGLSCFFLVGAVAFLFPVVYDIVYLVRGRNVRFLDLEIGSEGEDSQTNRSDTHTFSKNEKTILSSSQTDKCDTRTESRSSQMSGGGLMSRFVDEVLYFFKCVDVDLVIFEDLDRVKDTKIFSKLRELNTTINHSSGLRPRKVTFIYAVRNDTIKDAEERGKFFDYELSISPVLNPMSTENELINRNYGLRRSDPGMAMTENFIKGVYVFIPDMRVLNNAFNDYFFMYSKIFIENNRESVLKTDNLFAMSLYKNLYPGDYELLEEGRGIIPDIYRDMIDYDPDKDTDVWENDGAHENEDDTASVKGSYEEFYKYKRTGGVVELITKVVKAWAGIDDNDSEVAEGVQSQIDYLCFLFLNRYIGEDYDEYVNTNKTGLSAYEHFLLREMKKMHFVGFDSEIVHVKRFVTELSDDDFRNGFVMIKPILANIETIRRLGPGPDGKNHKYENIVDFFTKNTEPDMGNLQICWFIDNSDQDECDKFLAFILSHRLSACAGVLKMIDLDFEGNIDMKRRMCRAAVRWWCDARNGKAVSEESKKPDYRREEIVRSDNERKSANTKLALIKLEEYLRDNNYLDKKDNYKGIFDLVDEDKADEFVNMLKKFEK